MRACYSFIFYLLVPVIVLRLLWRGIKAPDYRSRWLERFACYTHTFPQDVIWFHAVSVGEAEALFPLVKLIQNEYPEAKLLITTTTPTGSARVNAVLKGNVEHVYLPYDLPDAVSRFMRCFKPRLAVIMETEIWPNLYASCGKNDIPLYVINARLSEKSARGYQKIAQLVRPALAQVKLFAAQTQDDANRFVVIGANAEKVVTVGNIKFDVLIPQEIIDQGLALKNVLFADRFTWICASTHKGEEKLCLEIYQALKQAIPELILLIAPRHPERFSDVRLICEQQKLNVVVRTSGACCNADTDVYLIDTLGELKMFYAASDIAFIGGSLVPVGGHNVLEAAAIGTPAVFGPYMNNFKHIAKEIIQQEAAVQAQNPEQVRDAILSLYQDQNYRESLGRKGKAFIEQNRGAIGRVFKLLEQEIQKAY
jgi:3-deoxy-D-manno-octulosonic-acid transferase